MYYGLGHSNCTNGMIENGVMGSSEFLSPAISAFGGTEAIQLNHLVKLLIESRLTTNATYNILCLWVSSVSCRASTIGSHGARLKNPEPRAQTGYQSLHSLAYSLACVQYPSLVSSPHVTSYDAAVTADEAEAHMFAHIPAK